MPPVREEEEPQPDDSLALARVAIRFGSWMQVVLSGIGLILLLTLFTFIENRLDMPGHSEFFMYSTICTTSIMVVAGIVGVLTTWKKGILLRGGPRTRRFALYKALMECGLFAYMTPFIFTVCYWFLTTPNVSIWIRATKCVMELPSIIFQFTWAAACLKYWHMLVEDAKEARLNRDRVSEPLLPGGGNSPSSPTGSAAYSEVDRWTNVAHEKAPTSPRVREKRQSGGSAPFGPSPAANQASAAPYDTTEDLAALLGVTVEAAAPRDGGALRAVDGKQPLQIAEGFEPAQAGDVPASLSGSSSHSGPLQAALAPVNTSDDAQNAQGDEGNEGDGTAQDGAVRGKFRSPRAGSAADTAAAFAGVTPASGLNSTNLRRDVAAAAYDPVDTASQRAARRFGPSYCPGNSISDENSSSVSISKLVGMLKARTTAPNLDETFAGRGPAATWKPGTGVSGTSISGALKNGNEKTSPAKRGSGGTSQRWGPGAAPLSTNNFDGAASSDDEMDEFQSPPRDNSDRKKRRSLPGFGGSSVSGATTVLGTKVSNVLSRMRASVGSGTGSSGSSGPGYQERERRIPFSSSSGPVDIHPPVGLLSATGLQLREKNERRLA